MKIFVRVAVCFILIIISLSTVYSKKISPTDSETANSIPYPRIANLYNSQLAWVDEERIKAYLAKLDLIIGAGGYDFGNSWEDKKYSRIYDQVEASIAKLRSIKPTILILPYVDVIEGPFNTYLPEDFWLRDSQGDLVRLGPEHIESGRIAKRCLNTVISKSRLWF